MLSQNYVYEQKTYFLSYSYLSFRLVFQIGSVISEFAILALNNIVNFEKCNWRNIKAIKGGGLLYIIAKSEPCKSIW